MNENHALLQRSFRRIIGIVALLLLTFTIFPRCGGDTPEIEGPSGGNGGSESKLPDISTYKVGDIVEMGFNEPFHLPYSGISTSDYLQLVSRGNTSETYKMQVSATNEEGATLTAATNFIGGMFELTFYKNGTPVKLGSTFVDVIDNTKVPQAPGSTAYGRVIDAKGKPLSGISVSDGVLVTTTDKDGQYYLSSLKKQGYVFITIPSGYKAAVNRSIPQFFKRLKGSSSTYEQSNFILSAEDNTRHRLVVFTDTHLANRTDDVLQFENGFKADLKKEIIQAKNDGVKLYAMALGDLTWDEYWYKNSYQPADYYKQMQDLDLPIYSIPGNHDNDPYIADDFKSEKAWRDNIGPTYYSFNIGDIHYIQMDNTLFTNTGGSQGNVGSLNYTEGFTQDQFKWLEANLKNVPAGKTIIMGIHIQYTNRYKVSNGSLSWGYSMPADQRAKIENLLSSYNVHIVSGHTHIKYTNFIKDNMMEHNVAAVCATWWWTGKYTNNKSNMCRDGVPSGYEVFEIGASNSNNLTYHYQSIGKKADYQFRAYDLNNCLITREQYCPNIKDNFKTVSAEFFSQYANGYDKLRNDNAVMVNVFNWNEKWQVKVREVETNKNLIVTQIEAYDPLHTIHFNMNRMNTNSTAMTFPALATSHMFEVTCSSPTTTLEITVTDNFGRNYTETMVRPRDLYNMSISDKW